MPFAVKNRETLSFIQSPFAQQPSRSQYHMAYSYFSLFLPQQGYIIYHTIWLLSLLRQYLTCASIGPPMLVIKLAEQALRPKRIGSLALPLASFGGPLKRGVRYMEFYYKKESRAAKGFAIERGTAV